MIFNRLWKHITEVQGDKTVILSICMVYLFYIIKFRVLQTI